MTKTDVKVDLKGVINTKHFWISTFITFIAILLLWQVIELVDKYVSSELSTLTKVSGGIILAYLKGIVDSVFKLNNESMSYAIEKAITSALSEVNSHFTPRNPVFPESKDGIVVKLNSHFEKGGIVEVMQSDVSELKGHFEKGGVINQILDQLKLIRKENKKPERSSR